MNTKILTLSTLILLISACDSSKEGKDIEETIKNQQGEIAISGALEYGANLEATITDPDGTLNISNATYQWQRNAVNITGGTGIYTHHVRL